MNKSNDNSFLECFEVTGKKEKSICFRIRENVFVTEMKMFEGSDVDSFDDEAIHIAVKDKDGIIGTVRVYRDEEGRWFGGRLAVNKGKRRGNAARMLVKKAEEIASRVGADFLFAMVQEKNVNFFLKNGWNVEKGPVEHHKTIHYLMSVKTGK